MTRKFQRRIEDFVCLNCGFAVVGDGYTNHCPKCLCSQHVDVNPGDRAADCGGVMRPVGIDQRRGEYVIVQRCETCGHTRPNRVHVDDDRDAIAEVARQIADPRG